MKRWVLLLGLLWALTLPVSAAELPEDYLETLRKEQAARKFTVTGILLDAGNPGMDFSLTPFCQKIYRTSELAGDEIVRGLVSQRM